MASALGLWSCIRASGLCQCHLYIVLEHLHRCRAANIAEN